ncbi:RNI-like protein [Suhomyces tanzawaensis NRRL Y-17324]|uniref:RNI-like protein n=1 Tax=Suhomyces tanzawaensis NRRL Y-17324 TaxID=984487 RepID=A0A1E4SGG1_9ASCO|nr:RNI-like protein [Suhomyces tanzawaensis NRRL Y-17324]ODV78502.1 RNI-like protein [Suhomyces tanzawaensis NRRL Y-17324]
MATVHHLNLDLGITPENTYSLAGKQIKFDSSADIEQYVKELDLFKDLKKIDFSGNTIGIEASKTLSEALLKHKDTIVEINFSDLYTGRLNTEIPQSLEYLLPSLLQLTNLKVVNLSDNAFGLQTIDPIEAYLAKAVTIEHLILSNNGMGPFAGARIGGSLFKLATAKKAAGKSSLKTFICGRNRLENGSINYLAVGLRNHKDLEKIRLYQNGIRPAGISKLIEQGLASNKKLKVVDLQDNTITTPGAVKLADSLGNWPELVELNLNDCLLKNKGSLNLVESLNAGAPKTSITTLRLQYNELEEDSLKVLVEAVKEKLPNLKVLELNGNRFEEDSEFVEQINEVFEERGYGELDELDELEELDSDEEDEDDEDEDDQLEDDLDLNELEANLAGKLEEHGDSNVDEIADELSKTHIK